MDAFFSEIVGGNSRRPAFKSRHCHGLISFPCLWRQLKAIASLLGPLPQDPTEFLLLFGYDPLAVLARRESSFRPVDALDVWNGHSDVFGVSGHVSVTVIKWTCVSVLNLELSRPHPHACRKRSNYRYVRVHSAR